MSPQSKIQSAISSLLLFLCFAISAIAAPQQRNEIPSILTNYVQEAEKQSNDEQQPDSSPEPSRARDQVTMELIDEELSHLEETELEETEKATILKHFLDARQHLALANTAESEAAAYRLEAQNAIEDRDELRQKLEALDASVPAPDSLSEKLAELEAEKLKLENEAEAFRVELKYAIEEPDRRSKRLLDFPQLENDAQTRLAEVRKQLGTEAPKTEKPLLTRARMVKFQTERQQLEQELNLLKAERDAYETNTGIFPLKQELAEKQLERVNTHLAAIVGAIGRQREEEIETLLSETRYNLECTPDPLKSVAEYNLELALELADETKKLKSTKLLRSEGQSAVQKVESELRTMQSRVEAIGLSYEVGSMLRRDKTELVNRETPFQNSQVEDKLQSVQVKKFQWQDERAELSEAIDAVELEIKNIGLEIESTQLEIDSSKQGSEAETEATDQLQKLQGVQSLKDHELKLLKERRRILGKLEDTGSDLFNDLFDIETLQAQYTKKSNEFADFLDERILWVRSEPVLGFGDYSGIREAANWLTLRKHWEAVTTAIVRGVQANLPSVVMIGIGLLGLVLLQPRSRSELKRQGAIAVKRGSREFTPTVSAFFQTAVLSFFWPAIGLTLGWLITSQGTGIFAPPIGRGLTVTSLVAIPFELMRCVCRNEGLAQNHFAWAEGFRVAVRKHTGWFITFGLPLLFLIVSIEASNNSDFNRLGRVAMLILLAICMMFSLRIYSVFRPGGSAFIEEMTGFDSTVSRLRSLVFLAVMIGFVLLFLFAVMGYYESVYKIGTSLLQTVIALICTVVAFGLAMRFFLVRRRKLRFEQLIQQRKAAIAAAEKQAESGISIASEALDIDLQNESGMDITDVSRQARELTGVIFLIAIGLTLLGIWQYLLPATKILDSWELWRITVGSEVEFVTARDLLLSLIAFALTFFSVRNIPGMLELLLLQRLPLDAGARYAVASIFRYILLVVGVIIALGYLKIPWSNYSWLVAAISVGLGFGLQEIVANFVSGLILLLERPVRVGDVVTIDGVTGIVSRIQMRATTITNWDNQELVVPNKDLISGKLLNWTLSSVINRIALKVGVAYGTDLAKVREIITKIVDRHPDILKEPAAVITFEEFGDSSLNFVIRCCTTSIKRRWNLIDEINTAVNEAFQREGIEIPFPQRVVHLVQEDVTEVASEE